MYDALDSRDMFGVADNDYNYYYNDYIDLYLVLLVVVLVSLAILFGVVVLILLSAFGGYFRCYCAEEEQQSIEQTVAL